MVDFFGTRIGEMLYSSLALKAGHSNAFHFAFQDRKLSALVNYLNTRNLDKGLDSEGDRIENKYSGGEAYTDLTEEIYRETIGRIIQAGSNYTMKYSGDFWKSIKLGEPNLDFVLIESDPIKNSYNKNGFQDGQTNLFNVYGDKLIGLQEKDYIILIKNVLPLYLKYARGILGIN